MKRLFGVIVVAALCVGFVACGIKFNLEEYKTLIVSCQLDMEESFINIGNMANYEINFMTVSDNIGYNTGPSELAESAKEWLYEESGISTEDLEIQYNNICTKYKEILAIEVEGQEAEKIQSTFFELYENFNDLHFAVMQPSATTNDFASAALDNMNDFMKNDESLKTLLS